MVARDECEFQKLHDGPNVILTTRAPFVEKWLKCGDAALPCAG
jgi:hypothetical protein